MPSTPGSPGALLRRGPLRTVRATRRCTRLKQAARATRGAAPSGVALKIRCRSRRTIASWARQSTLSQLGPSPSGPFTAGSAPPRTRWRNCIRSSCPTCPSVPAACSSSLQRLTCLTSGPFGAGHQARYPASYTQQSAEERTRGAALSCRLSATGIRFLGILSRPGISPPLRSAYGASTRDTDPREVSTFPHARNPAGIGRPL
jgi:hypothetical protein